MVEAQARRAAQYSSIRIRIDGRIQWPLQRRHAHGDRDCFLRRLGGIVRKAYPAAETISAAEWSRERGWRVTAYPPLDEVDGVPGAERFEIRAFPAIAALVSLALLAACVSVGPGPVLLQFGMVGTFAPDCNQGIADGGSRAIYDVPPVLDEYPTITAINRFGTFRSRIMRADRIGADRLIMYTDDPSGTWNEIDIEKAGNGFAATRMVSHKPNGYPPVIAIGDRAQAANGAETLFLERCAPQS